MRIGLALASAVILTLSVTGWAASERYLSGLAKVDVFGGLAGGTDWTGQPTTILLVGSDDRSGLTDEEASRLHTGSGDFGKQTDTIMLVHLGGDLGTVSVISIPRDSLVTIPAHTGPDGAEVAAHQAKINSAFASGGPALTVKTVEQATGVTIDHYVEVNFKGFLSIVDAVGGVDVCLAEPLQDRNSGLNLPAGRQTVSGKQALAYVRARYIDNDFGRAGRQQKFLAAMTQKVLSSGTLLNPLTLNATIEAVVSALTTDEALTRDAMAALAAHAVDLDLSKIQFTTVPVSDGNHMVDGQSTVLWDAQQADELFTAIREDQPLPKPRQATAVPVAPGEISVAVTGPQASAAGEALRAAGFVVTGAQVTAPTAAGTTTVRYDPAWANSLETMKAALPDATFVEAAGIGGVFAIEAGADWSGLQPVRAAATSVDRTVRTAQDDICG